MRLIKNIAGHSLLDRGARGVVYKGMQLWENEMTILWRDNLTDIMQMRNNEYCYVIHKDNDNFNLTQVINQFNQLPGGKHRLLQDIHFNAFNKKAHGVECFVPDSARDIEVDIANIWCTTISEIAGLQNRGVKPESKSQHKKLAIMRPNAIVVLPELCFIDNHDDVDRLFSNMSEIIITLSHRIMERMNVYYGANGV